MGIREQYPLLYAFGDKTTFLKPDETLNATVNQRIESIWPFIASRVIAFQQTLTRRERANWDHEDTISDLVAVLIEKDSCWNPGRGKYITFAGSMIDHALYAIRDIARTVHSPRNSCCRIKEYRAEEANGSLTSRRAKTANDIRRTQSGIKGIVAWEDKEYDETAELASDEAADSPLSQTEDASKTTKTVADLVKTLTPREARVVGSVWGLWGQPRKSLHRLAWETGDDPIDLAKTKSQAVAKIRRILKSKSKTV